jgi:hypothetical protein
MSTISTQVNHGIVLGISPYYSLLTITNTGTISGASVGINLFAGGSITNTNSIIGSDGIGVISASGAYAALYIGGDVALRAAANAP